MPSSRAFSAAGCQFAISAVLPASHNIPGFEALSFTNIGEIVDGGSAGKTYNTVEHSPLNLREVISRKGSFTQGTRDLSLGRDIIDAGQDLVLTALNIDTNQAFRILYQNGDIDYITATVNSFTDEIGTQDTIVSATVSLSQEDETIRMTNTGVLTASVNTPGLFTGLTDGTFPATQASTSGSGTGAEFEVTLVAGAVTAAVPTKTGNGYVVADTITLVVVGPTETTAAVLDVDTIVTAL